MAGERESDDEVYQNNNEVYPISEMSFARKFVEREGLLLRRALAAKRTGSCITANEFGSGSGGAG